MGTSASYRGPKGTSSLLPPWAPPVDSPDFGDLSTPPADSDTNPQPDLDADGRQDGEVQPLKPVPWSQPRAALARFASSTGRNVSDRRQLGSALRKFVGAQGGARRAAQAARAGRASAQRLGGFLATVA